MAYTEADLRQLQAEYRAALVEANGVPQMPLTRIAAFAAEHDADPRQVLLDLLHLDD
jgi:hypothetical protein